MPETIFPPSVKWGTEKTKGLRDQALGLAAFLAAAVESPSGADSDAPFLRAPRWLAADPAAESPAWANELLQAVWAPVRTWAEREGAAAETIAAGGAASVMTTGRGCA